MLDMMGLLEFFSSELSAVSDLDPDIEVYVVHTLVSFASEHIADGPFCLDVMSARDYQTLRRAGDSCVFLAGFMRERVENGPLSVRYYVQMGSMAYEKIASHWSFGGGVYGKLSSRSGDVVDSLWRLRLRLRGSHPEHTGDVLRLLRGYDA